MVTRKQVRVQSTRTGDFIAHVQSVESVPSTSQILGYGCTEKEAVQRLANNLSYYGIGHAL